MTLSDVVLVAAVVLVCGLVADRVACWVEARRLDQWRRDPAQLRLAQRKREAIERATAGRSGRGPR